MAFATHRSIDLSRLLESVSGVGLGGTAVFVGTVRRGPDDGPVAWIDYSAYVEMLEAEFGRILNEAANRWPQARLGAQHRLGRVPVGEASIAVVAGAPHRAEAMEACQYIIEEAKKRLPVWKREFYTDGRVDWLPGRDPRTTTDASEVAAKNAVGGPTS